MPSCAGGDSGLLLMLLPGVGRSGGSDTCEATLRCAGDDSVRLLLPEVCRGSLDSEPCGDTPVPCEQDGSDLLLLPGVGGSGGIAPHDGWGCTARGASGLETQSRWVGTRRIGLNRGEVGWSFFWGELGCA